MRKIDCAAFLSRLALSMIAGLAPTDRLNLNARSLCDYVSPGMTKDAVAKLAQDRNLRLEENQQARDSWFYEENGFSCKILFDQAGTVVKKKKTIFTD